jgi:folylpolyglutamate synthase/dihydrofolate synthase
LLEAAEAENPEKVFGKPKYFRYLTLMSYHVFLREGVDVAVYETGVGGEFDATNLVEHPIVTGISAIGFDHLYSLGRDVKQIAWHKAGIQKRHAPSFSVQQQWNVRQVLFARAKEKGANKLKFLDHDPRLEGVKIRPDADFQRSNATLAIALAETALKKIDPKYKRSSQALQKEFVDGLEQVVWRGRCETKVDGNITWYLDGAHTAESIEVAATWFGNESSEKYALLPDYVEEFANVSQIRNPLHYFQPAR